MNGSYDFVTIERRWQEAWDNASVYHTPDEADDPTYVLGMYPYPSGKLHMGHVRNYTITDASARYRRMRGDDVLHPMGWDAFGLPAENAAKERDTSPRDWTFGCIDTMREQMQSMGFGYDWDREIITCTPEYYKWTQWLFTCFADADLVERRDAEVNWCPSCETVLVDEQVEGDAELCWRCDTPVETRDLDQWFLKITEYADELLEAIDDLEGWPNSVRQMQRNWIGRQYGTTLDFDVEGHGPVEAFTTRVDTVHGATFFALAPDHPISEELAAEDDELHRFVHHEADPEGDEPNGVETDLTATNPATGEEIPVFVADFVLSDVGTGALMAVPGHDERDHAFAKKMGVDIEPVVAPEPDDWDGETVPEAPDVSDEAFTDDGVLVNSGEYSGLDSETARERLTEDIESAEESTQYQLRDWGISRQRYWGTPIPVVHCDDCGPVTVPDEDLPVELPEFINTTGNPLDAAEEWKATTCPECGAPATRETDTMDTFVDSSWYFLRYVSPDLDDAPFDLDRANDWMPVDQYVGGIEHAVMHLLYSRFFTKVLADEEGLEHREPFTNLLAQGMVRGEDGNKMSKSRGNVASPQRFVEEYGADTIRLYMMEAAQPEKDFIWAEKGVQSSHRFLQNVYQLADEYTNSTVTTGAEGPEEEYVAREIDSTVKQATEEFECSQFNRALQLVRELVSLLRRYEESTEFDPDILERGLSVSVRLLAPVAPHLAEEAWELLNRDDLVVEADWPVADPPEDYNIERRLVENTIEDVREIVDLAGIDNPQTITIAVAPEWKHSAYELVRTTGGDTVSTIMNKSEFRKQGEVAADFAKDLTSEAATLDEQLPPEREQAALERAAWLLEHEFDTRVVVRSAVEADDRLINNAAPGRPAIDIKRDNNDR